MRKKQRGLTLVELMVTLAVAIILVAVGMPLFSGVAANNRATAQANALVSAIKLARSEAIKRGETVTICSVKTDKDDIDAGNLPECGTAAQWSKGWTVHFDDGSAIDEHIRTWPAPENNPPSITTASASIGFDATGANTSGATVSLSLQLTGSTGNRPRCIVVTGAGQTRAYKYYPDDGETCP